MSLMDAKVSDVPAREAEIERDPAGNRCGRARILTLITPVRPFFVPMIRLVMRTSSRLPFVRRDSLQFNFIYTVRWALFRRLPYHGPPQKPDNMRYTYMYFASNFDTPWKQYIDAFAYVIPRDIAGLWGRGPDFPNPPPAEPLKRWIARNSMQGGYYYAAYPHASVKMIQAGLRVKGSLAQLAAEAERMSPAEFQTAYRKFLHHVQNDL